LSAGAALAKGASYLSGYKIPAKKIAFGIAGGKSAGQRAKALEYAEEYAGIHRTSAFAETGEASFNVTMYRWDFTKVYVAQWI
jgi:hypothetical protein